jgi:membrane protein implicated in regulation of membrane protease activity
MGESSALDDGSLGHGFWLRAAAVLVAVAVGVLAFFFLLSLAFWTLGIFGALLAFAAIMLFVAWLYDRREARARGDL